MSKLRHPSRRHRRPRPARRLTPRSSRHRSRRGRPLSPCATTSPPPGRSSCPTTPTAWSTTTATSSSTRPGRFIVVSPWDAAPDLDARRGTGPDPGRRAAASPSRSTSTWARTAPSAGRSCSTRTTTTTATLGLYGYVLAAAEWLQLAVLVDDEPTAPGPSTPGAPGPPPPATRPPPAANVLCQRHSPLSFAPEARAGMPAAAA